MSEKLSYEMPDIAMVGDFTEVTRLKATGNWADSIWGYFFCYGICE